MDSPDTQNPCPKKYRLVLGSVEKENLPAGCRTEGVHVMDSEREQPYAGHGAAMESTLPEFMKRVTEQMAQHKQELAQHKQELEQHMQETVDQIGKLQATVRHMQGRLDESAELYNDHTITIGQQKDRIETLEELFEAHFQQ